MNLNSLLLLSCIGFLVTGNIKGMEEDWHILLGEVKNRSTGSVTVKIRKPKSQFIETQIIRPHSSHGFLTRRFAAQVDLPAQNQLPLGTSIDIILDTGKNKSVQHEILAEKRSFNNQDVIDIEVLKNYKIKYKRKKWNEEEQRWDKYPGSRSEMTRPINV